MELNDNFYYIVKMKHTWTKKDNIVCSVGYIFGLSSNQMHRQLPHIKFNSIKMKYQNCLYLKRGPVRGSLKNCSKAHRNVWLNLN
jgi:hypothetical protein